MPVRLAVSTVLEFERDRVHAASIGIGDGRVALRGYWSKTYPDGARPESPVALGAWVGAELKAAGMPRNRVILAMPRGDVVLKKLSLPTAGVDKADLAGMVRLQMSRQLTMPISGASIDYLPPSTSKTSVDIAGADSGAEASTSSVMAGAMPSDRVSWCREVAEAGDMTLQRIGLKCFGVSALLAELSQRRDGTILGIALGYSTAEFVVVEDGQLVLARAVDVPSPPDGQDREGYAERIAVEAKRTWMSHKSARNSGEIECVAIIGDDEPARTVLARCSTALECGSECVSRPGLIDIPQGLTGSDLMAALPCAGLLLEQLAGTSTMDFAHPRKSLDRAAIKRQRALAAALVLILFSGGAWLVGRSSLNELRARDAKLKDRNRDLQFEVEKHLAQHARLAHIEQWSKARVEWMSFLDMLNQQLPEARLAVLDGLGGEITHANVEFVPKGKPYPDGVWSLSQEAAITLDGRMAERKVAADLRGKLLDLNFDSVESKGADVPDRFSFVLKTSLPAPKRIEAKPANSPSVPVPHAEAKKVPQSGGSK